MLSCADAGPVRLVALYAKADRDDFPLSMLLRDNKAFMKKRYVQAGMGGRSRLFTAAILGQMADACELAGICDSNPGRLDLANKWIIGQKKAEAVPQFRRRI